ncbi:glycosyltransferase family 4 protein [Xenorhabdus sp. TS4]|uniref:glycosyltransferase family 4 protein n=1 Tax=Xenorhabdus sp. TS4 TaxID=1873483 RepID=UPI001656D438|nr:glycosyltransferase family 4 protein [Xenorhabdus sp. TS4]MBC8951363.1 WbnE [Xenorhabdus sp. TS4]
MKIILIGTTADSMINFRKTLIKKMTESNHEVFCFAIDYNEEQRDKIKKLGATPINYNLSRSGLNPFSDIKNTIQLSRKIKSIKPDIVLSYFSKPSIYGSWAAKLAKTPNIFAMLEGLGFCFTSQKEGKNWKKIFLRKIQILLYKITFPKIDGLILLNKDDESDLVKKNNINVKTFILGGIGLDLNDYPYTPINKDNKISFIFIARLLKEKGIFEYINAAKIVKIKYPETTFNVLGAIDSENPGGIKLEQLEELKNTGVINYPGFVKNVNDWLSNSDVFVLPSYYREGIPRSTQEAMAIGRPIITTNVPGCKETVHEGKNGFLISPWSAEDLAEKMFFFIENPDFIEKMGQESYHIAKIKYDCHKVNYNLMKILKVL